MINEENRSLRLKNISFICKLRQSTYDNKIKWETIYKDHEICVFTATHKITDKKELFFSIRCNTLNIDDPTNSLRVFLNISDEKPPVKSSSEIIKKLNQKDYPILKMLIKLLKDKFLEKKIIELLSPIKDINDFENYKKGVVHNLDKSIDKLNVYEIMPLLEIREKILNSKSFKDVSDLLFNAHQIIEKIKKLK